MQTKIILDEELKNNADLKWALGLNKLVLRFMGVWPEEENVSKSFFNVLQRSPMMMLAMLVFLILPQTYALCLVMGELPLVLDNLITNGGTITGCIKLFFIWRSKKSLQPVMKSIVSDWLRSKSEWEHETMMYHASRARSFTIYVYFISIGTYLGYACSSFFGFSVRTINNITDYGSRTLMVQSAYPYDYSRSPNFEITWFLQVLAAFFISLGLNIPDSYFGALIYHTSAQFEILGDQIENFHKHCEKQTNESYHNLFRKKFPIFCNRHVHLLMNVETLEKSFCYVHGTQVLFASVGLICLGFQIVDMLNNPIDTQSIIRAVALVAGVFMLMLTTFVDCYASETLVIYNSGLVHNIYNSMWYEIHTQKARDIIPMITAAQRSKPLTAGKLFDLTLQLYCSLLKTSLGYISIFVAVNKS